MTDRDPAKPARRKDDARLRALAELSSDWYWEQDAEYRFRRIGVDVRNQSQLPMTELVGRTRWDSPGTNLSEAQWAAHRAALDARQTFHDLEYSYRGEDGVLRWFSVSGAPEFEADGTFIGYRGIARDITGRKHTERLSAVEHEVSRCLAREVEGPKALQAVIRTLCESEQWEMGRFWRREDAAGTLRAGEYWAPPDAPIRAYMTASNDVIMAPGLGLAGHVLKTGEPLWVADVSGDPRVFQKALLTEMGVHGVFLLPVASEGETLGVLSFSSREVRKPDALLLEAVGVIGSQVGQYLRRVRAEDDLRRFRAALDHSADMILLIDRRQMRYVDVNETVCRLLGYTREEFTSMGPQDVLPVDRETLERSYDALFANPAEAGSLRSYYRCKDGSRLPFESTRHVIRSGDGYLIAAISRDIRDRLAAEEALRDSETRFRTIFERSNAGITIRDTDGRFIAVNEAHARFLGYTQAEVMARKIEAMRSESDLEWDVRKEKFESGELEAYTRDRRFVRKDGSEVWGRLSVAPVRGEDGHVQYIISICTDISEARAASARIGKLNEELETRVAERTAELEALVQELESFTYTISHDLRAPLRGMSGFAEILLKEHAPSLPPEAQRMLGRVHVNARRMSELLDGLLAFARLGRRELDSKPVAMGALVDETWKELGIELQGRRVEFERGGIPDCAGDPVLLKQVWANLLANALKYTRGREPAVIAVGWNPEERAYFVRDNGAGFEMQYADKLFGVFSRLHTDEEFEGTGLGLAICERIVRRHGGWIRGAAQPGEGANFSFSL